MPRVVEGPHRIRRTIGPDCGQGELNSYRRCIMGQAVDKTYRLLAARFLRKHAKRLASQLEPVCAAEDVEAVHQARVASRRLRAALEMFADCFPAGLMKRWRKEIRRITKGLGPARDHDVQILFLAEHLAQASDPAHARGIAVLLGRLERDRSRYQPKVVRVAQRLRRAGVLEEIIGTTQKICFRAKAKGIDVRSSLAVKRAEGCLAERLGELREHAVGLDDPTAAAEHHAMRIAAKRLRYTLEMVAPVFPGEMEESIVAAKQLQTFLGEIHDYDVWDMRIDAFEEDMRRRTINHYGGTGPFAPLEAGLEHLRRFCRRRRRDVFDELCRFWAAEPLRGIERSSDASSPPTNDSPARCTHGRNVCCKTG
ncbi:MAG: CHAD domain-containing protein [Pirellulales bacterium]|nr:CHAD domain-containing protein [Pirellulales bacterium]